MSRKSAEWFSKHYTKGAVAVKSLVNARVIQVNRGQYVISVDGSEVRAVLSGKLQHDGFYPVIGDYVGAQIVSDKEAVIHEVKERISYLGRIDGSGHADGFVKTYLEQAMVANLDYLFIITSLNDDFSTNRIARFMATSIKGGCKPVIILTKADLCENKEEYINKLHEVCKDAEVYCVSSYTGEGIDEIKKFMKPEVTIGLMGSSGVGKSTLINTLAGSDVMKVSDIREKDSKGRHTTTHRQMINIDGTYFVDTPGMREFGICDVEEGINETFEDIADLVSCCRFSDCQHRSEPGCAILGALADGTLSLERWNLYNSLMTESNRTSFMVKKKKIAIQKKQVEKASRKGYPGYQ